MLQGTSMKGPVLAALLATVALGGCETTRELFAAPGGDAGARSLEVRLAEAEARNDALAREVAALRGPGGADANTVAERGRCYAPLGAGAEWSEVLCVSAEGLDVVRSMQTALAAAGHDPGPIDGIFGPLTSAAMASYQRANGLDEGYVTRATLSRLGVPLAP